MEIENWDYWIDEIDTIENLTNIEKEKSKKALREIQQFFNKDVQSLLESRHQFISYLVNRVAWTRKWFVYFINAIESAKNQINSEPLIEGIKDAEKFYSVLFELDIANRFIKSGFNVEFYPVIKTKKVPDFKITNPSTNEIFYVEVTEQMQSDQAKEATETFDRISHELNMLLHPNKRLICLGKIYKHLSEPHLHDVILKISEMIEKCDKSGFEEFVEDSAAFAFAKEENREDLKKWGDAHNVHSHLEGPSYDVDEIHRLSSKIKKEQVQLPEDHMNILVIRDTTLFFVFQRDIEKTISRLEEDVYKHDHLAFCVVLATYNAAAQEKIKIQGEHLYLHKTDDAVDREIVFLTNRYIKNKQITLDSISKIKHAFVEVKEFLL